ncbi:MAG: hypothetical protein ACPKM0_09875 [Pleomorphochaeta sp.]
MSIKKKIVMYFVLIALLILSACNLTTNEIYQLPSNLIGELEDWEGDIYFLEHELPNLHKDIYHSINEETYKNKIEKLKTECKDIDDEHRWVKIRTFTSLINDAHTSYSTKMTDAFPLNLVVLDDGVFVTAALNENIHLVRTSTETSTSPSRVELIKINGKPIFSSSDTENIFSILKTILSHENEFMIKSMMPSCLLDPSLLYGADIIPTKEKCTMTFLFPDGSEEDIELESKSLSTFKDLDWNIYYSNNYPADKSILPYYLQYNKEKYFGKYISSENTLYILYNSCSNDEEISFSTFIENQYSNCKNENVEKVIIDLRNNGGGDSRIIKPLYSLLKNELASSKLYVITGEKTFSSGLMNAIELSKDYNGILIGGATGGKPNHYGEVKSTQLPSKNYISWATKYFNLLPKDDSASLFPNVSVENTSYDFFNFEDPILSYILDDEL